MLGNNHTIIHLPTQVPDFSFTTTPPSSTLPIHTHISDTVKPKPPQDAQRRLDTWQTQPLNIALIFAIVAGFWIITCDTILKLMVHDSNTATLLLTAKNWAFLISSTAALWWYSRRLLIRIHKAEHDHKESLHQARAVFDGVSDAIFLHDSHTGRILDVNETACRMFGYSKQKLLALEIDDLSSGVEPYTQANAVAFISKSLHEKQEPIEWHCRHPDGRLFWIEISVCPAEIGNHPTVLVTGRDIDKRKQATEQLRKLSKAVEQSPVSIIITDTSGDIEYVNPATCRLTGYSPGELIGKSPGILRPEHTPAENFTPMWETIRQGKDWHGEFRNRKKNGELYWEMAAISAITDDHGKITHFLGVKEDITDRKRADHELQKSRAQLRALLARLQKAREDERTRISREVHDVLGQLLTGIKMDISWCQRRLPRIDNAETRSELTGKLASITMLTDSLLDSVQKISRDLRPSLLDNLGLIAALQFESRQFTHRTGIPCEITSLPESVDLSADVTTQMFRIFQEILTNVARHSHASQVSVALHRQRGELTLTVEDNGCGISPEARQDTHSLGLLGMSERAALISGRIRFHGAAGAGTKVDLTVPEMPSKNLPS